MAGGAGTWPEGVAVAAAVIETLEDARQQRELLRFERVRGLVGELERQHRWGSDTRRREQAQDDLATLLPSLGSYRRLPKTMALARLECITRKRWRLARRGIARSRRGGEASAGATRS